MERRKIVRKKMSKVPTPTPIKRCIISIDVGVKNLAVCVLSQSDRKDNTTDIMFWKLYNVTESKSKPKVKSLPNVLKGTCQNIIKRTKKQCGKQGVINSRGRAYCGTHDPSKRHTPDDTQNWCYAMLKMLPNITDDILLTFNEKSTSSYEDIISKLEIVIEQQAMDNKKILLQSHIIFGHFVNLFDNKVPVRFTPAYNKLLVYEGPDITCTLKTPYARRKYFAKKHTEYFLKKEPLFSLWIPFFESCKTKQDDISDAFLQGLYVLRKNDLRPKMEDAPVKGKRRRKVRW